MAHDGNGNISTYIDCAVPIHPELPMDGDLNEQILISVAAVSRQAILDVLVQWSLDQDHVIGEAQTSVSARN